MSRIAWGWLFAGAITSAVSVGAWTCRSISAAGPAGDKPVKQEPVERDMHEFMEYAFQPTYRRLKGAMAVQPTDKVDWKAIKSDSLILAEGGNLLLARPPETDMPSWNELSASVRSSGGEIYRAARMKDFPAARRHYEAMLTNCNRCHDKFAGGEHQLVP